VHIYHHQNVNGESQGRKKKKLRKRGIQKTSPTLRWGGAGDKFINKHPISVKQGSRDKKTASAQKKMVWTEERKKKNRSYLKNKRKKGSLAKRSSPKKKNKAEGKTLRKTVKEEEAGCPYL